MKHHLVLATLALIFTMITSAHGKDCKVNDPDISNHYEGGCKNGLAHGEGKAKGRDEYNGPFLEGEVHGYGEYTWGDGTEWDSEHYIGWHYKGLRSGYGENSVRINSKHQSLDWFKVNGNKEGNRYVVRGLRLNNKLVQKCASQTGCFKQFAESQNSPSKSNRPAEKISKEKFRSRFSKMLMQQVDMPDLPANLINNVNTCFIDMIMDEFPVGDDGFITLDESSVGKMKMLRVNKKLTEEKIILCMISSEYKLVDFNVLKVDMYSMGGEKVSVEGVGVHVMDLFILKRNEDSNSMIIIDIGGIERDQKVMVINKCANPALGCRVTIHGHVGDVNYKTEIVADFITFQ
jgi:hypothetical protein